MLDEDPSGGWEKLPELGGAGGDGIRFIAESSQQRTQAWTLGWLSFVLGINCGSVCFSRRPWVGVLTYVVDRIVEDFAFLIPFRVLDDGFGVTEGCEVGILGVAGLNGTTGLDTTSV